MRAAAARGQSSAYSPGSCCQSDRRRRRSVDWLALRRGRAPPAAAFAIVGTTGLARAARHHPGPPALPAPPAPPAPPCCHQDRPATRHRRRRHRRRHQPCQLLPAHRLYQLLQRPPTPPAPPAPPGPPAPLEFRRRARQTCSAVASVTVGRIAAMFRVMLPLTFAGLDVVLLVVVADVVVVDVDVDLAVAPATTPSPVIVAPRRAERDGRCPTRAPFQLCSRGRCKSGYGYCGGAPINDRRIVGGNIDCAGIGLLERRSPVRHRRSSSRPSVARSSSTLLCFPPWRACAGPRPSRRLAARETRSPCPRSTGCSRPCAGPLRENAAIACTLGSHGCFCTASTSAWSLRVLFFSSHCPSCMTSIG